jgi:Protein of unknown function with PCYCGC motif
VNIKRIVLYVLVLCLLLVTACSKDEPKKNNVDHNNHESPSSSQKSDHGNSDIREETKNVETLPSFLSEKPENIQTIYKAAAMHKELLEKMPCYCGCGEESGHKNNYDCFVNENNPDGSLVWDDHGTKCGVCLEIAAKSVLDFSEGKSIQEIREKIDTVYEKGYAKPTPTPGV